MGESYSLIGQMDGILWEDPKGMAVGLQRRDVMHQNKVTELALLHAKKKQKVIAYNKRHWNDQKYPMELQLNNPERSVQTSTLTELKNFLATDSRWSPNVCNTR